MKIKRTNEERLSIADFRFKLAGVVMILLEIQIILLGLLLL